MADSVLLKGLSLVFLVAQGAILPLLMRYIRTREVKDRFINASLILLVELGKTFGAAAIIIIQERSIFRLFSSVWSEVVGRGWTTAKAAVPAGLYLLQNSLYLVAVSNLPAAVFIVTYQLKILTTAWMAVTILGKQLRTLQVVSLFLLLFGVCTVQLSGQEEEGSEMRGESPLLGFGAVLVMALCSGFAGVFTEKLMKESKASVMVENIRLEVPTLPLALATLLFYHYDEVSTRGWLTGVDWVVWATAAVSAGGGLLIALILRIAGSIAKTYAQCLAIVFTALGSVLWFGASVSPMFGVGCVTVVSAVGLYNYNPTAAGASPGSPPTPRHSTSSPDLIRQPPAHSIRRTG